MDIYKLKIITDSDTLHQLKNRLEYYEIETTDLKKTENLGNYNFDLSEVASIMTIISGATAMFHLSKSIFLAIKNKKTIEVKSPIGRIIFIPEENLTEGEIRERLKKITEII